MTTIRYFIPEDGDVELQPNVFLAPKPRQSGMPPTLGQVKSAFPLPGRYHFRFKSPLMPGGDREAKSVAVWMDCVDDRQPVPAWRNSIVAKVTRTGVEDEEDEDDDDDDDFRGRGTPAPQQQRAPAPAPRPAPAPAPRPAPASEPMLDIFDSNPASTHSAPSSNNLFDAPNAPASLLDMGAPAAYHQPAANDFLGMTAPAPATPQQQQQQQQGYGTPYPPQQQQAPRSGSGGFNAYGQQQQQQQHQQQSPFGGLGTPWK